MLASGKDESSDDEDDDAMDDSEDDADEPVQAIAAAIQSKIDDQKQSKKEAAKPAAKSSEEPKTKKQKLPSEFIVECLGIYNGIRAPHIEEALEDAHLPFVYVLALAVTSLIVLNFLT